MADPAVAHAIVVANSDNGPLPERRGKPGPKKTWILTGFSTKTCNQCGLTKPIPEFSPESRGIYGVSAKCRACRSQNQKERYSGQRDRVLARVSEYRLANPEKVRRAKLDAMAKKPEHYRSKSRNWKKNNPERINANERARRARRADELRPLNRAKQRRFYLKKRLSKSYALNRSFSSAICRCLAGAKLGRSWRHLVPYSPEHLKRHLERQFLPGMSWENYGIAWQVDHILPIASFSFETAECPDFKACWALTNLRPLCKRENQTKSATRTFLL